MKHLDRWHRDFDNILSLRTLLEVDNTMVFESINVFIARPNYPPSQVVMWVDHTDQYQTNVEIINKANTSYQSIVFIMVL